VDRRDQRAARPPGPVPYGFGIVELDRVGLRVVGRLNETDPSVLRYAQPMEAVADELPGGRVVCAFAPAARVERIERVERVERIERVERVEPVDQP
jgi:DUF35 OB-fold domain, acyl-CoA-associated